MIDLRGFGEQLGGISHQRRRDPDRTDVPSVRLSSAKASKIPKVEGPRRSANRAEVMATLIRQVQGVFKEAGDGSFLPGFSLQAY